MSKLLTVFLLLSGILYCYVASSSEEVIKKLLSPDEVKNMKDYYCCEMLEYYGDQPNLGAELTPDVKFSYHNLMENDTSSVYSIFFKDSLNTTDMYVHMKNIEGKWKIEAIRTLSLPKFYYMIMDSLKAESHLPDSLQYMYDQMKVVTKTDAQLKSYLNKNLNGFNKLLKLVMAHPEVERVSDFNIKPENPDKNFQLEVRKQMHNLYVSFINRNNEYSKVIFFSIGGIMNNEVGFFYSDKGAHIPQMSSKKFIYIERITGNWYVYKTT